MMAFWAPGVGLDRKSTRLNSSHPSISYAVFCLKKKSAPGEGRGDWAPGLRIGGRCVQLHAAMRPLQQPKAEAIVPLCFAVGIVFIIFFLMIRRPPRSPLFPSPPLFR